MNLFTQLHRRLATLFLTLCVVIPVSVQAQDENEIVQFLNAGKEDASKLMNAYLSPMVEGLSYGFNGGWAQTAKAHKTLGFDLMINANAVFIPSSKYYFDPYKLGLATIVPGGFTSEAPNGLAPTIIGPDYNTRYNPDLNGDGVPDQAGFDGPEGFDFKDKIKVVAVGAPTVTLGIGIIKNTDLKIRWVPEVGSETSKIKLIGFGVMHDIKQHIPGIKILPFDLSVLAAYTKVQGYSNVSGAFEPAPGDNSPQRINYDMNAWLIQALISKKLSVITFYGGVGYNAVKTQSHVVGSYVVASNGQGQDIIFEDPINLTFKNNGLRATAGFRLKLAVLCLSADYTLQQYNTLSVGLGVSVR